MLSNSKRLVFIIAGVAILVGGVGCYFFPNSAGSLILDGRIDTTTPVSNLAGVTFPRLAGCNIGNPHNYHELSYQKELAKRDLIILGLYDGWSKGGKTPAQVVSEIKALNPDILIANYTIMTDISDAQVVHRKKLDSEIGPGGVGDWWGRDKRGRKMDWAHGAWGSHDVNITSFVEPDANGDRWPQWLAKNDYELLLEDVDFDIWYFDNNFWRPRSAADWNRDGTNDQVDDPVVRGWWRAGQRAHYQQAADIAPQLYLVANADNDLSGKMFPPKAESFGEYKNVLHGALMEHAISKKRWSVETWGGWEMMMEWYYELFNNLLKPKIVIFEVWGGAGDYQTFRYAFASVLLHDGYFAYSADEDYRSYQPLPWFDEYDLAGTATTKWLGKAVDVSPTSPWQNGVYRRRFEGGMVLVNPKGNGAQTVTVEPGYKRIAGSQVPGVNNGQPADTITLKARDGIILEKMNLM